jgi:hypothetical protein
VAGIELAFTQFAFEAARRVDKKQIIPWIREYLLADLPSDLERDLLGETGNKENEGSNIMIF